MQKVFNLLGVLGFVMSGTMAVMGVVAYTRVPSMVKNYASNLKLELTKTILDQPVPEMPEMRRRFHCLDTTEYLLPPAFLNELHDQTSQ